MSSHKCMECIHGSVCDSFEGSHAKNCEFFKPEQQWISVEDRLPEIPGRYLVCCKRNRVVIDAEWMVGQGEETESGFCRRDLESTYKFWFDTNPVTHWMPLPEPQKEATE